MLRTNGRSRALAVLLSATAGYVDAVGFLKLGGFFVSFMSGNTTRAAVGLAQGSNAAPISLGLIFTFVTGVMLGSVAGRIAHRHSMILGLVALLLALAALLGTLGIDRAAIIAVTLAMGAENTTFERDGEVHIGLTYMTGTLVKLGQHLTSAFFGGAPMAWLPYLMLWISLASGAVVGALVYPHLGLLALWPAALMITLLAIGVARTAGDRTED